MKVVNQEAVCLEEVDWGEGTTGAATQVIGWLLILGM